MHFYFVELFSVRAPQINEDVFGSIKSGEKKIEWKCMSMHMISVKHVFLWAGWCVLALQFFMK